MLLLHEDLSPVDQVATSRSPGGPAAGEGRPAGLHLGPGRKDFTAHQLFAILALKTFFKTDYRGVAQLLTDLGDLRKDLDLEKVPHLLDPVLRGRAAATSEPVNSPRPFFRPRNRWCATAG